MPQVDLSNPRQKLKLFASPVAHAHALPVDGDHSTGSSLKDRSERTFTGLTVTSDEGEEGIPQLKRYHEPTLLEIFFDLFFAANNEVFGDTQRVTSHSKLKAYIGYFALLWLTWFMVTLYDVRFTTDSMFARFTKGIHFGVLVGFAVVTPKFDPTDQNSATMKTMSLILMISRLCLAAEYMGTLVQLRKFPRARKPIILQAVLHVVAAMVYLGIAFTFHNNVRTRAYMTWYFIAGIEAILSLILSYKCPILSLTKTHLMKRMTLLTIMFMGDGLVQIAKEVVLIVQHRNAWDAPTIGSITAAVATVYFVFLVYFDWLRSNYYLSKVRQIIWTAIHLPFHLVLVLFMQSFTQYLIWAKILVQLDRAFGIANAVDPQDGITFNGDTTTMEVVQSINASIQQFLVDWPPKIITTGGTLNDALKDLSKIPDNFWGVIDGLSDDLTLIDPEDLPDVVNDWLPDITEQFLIISSALVNTLFGAFGIDVSSDVIKKEGFKPADLKSGDFQLQVQEKTWSRYALEFVTGYIASGCTLLFMALLTIIVRNTQWKRWPIIRLVLVISLAIGMGCTATLWFANTDTNDQLFNYLFSLWVLPTITLVWTLVIVLTHINGDMLKEPLIYSWQKLKEQRTRFRLKRSKE